MIVSGIRDIDYPVIDIDKQPLLNLSSTE